MNPLESIRIFKRVADLKSFSGVAKELELTQPTISKSIQALERELGVTLFRRTTRGLSLTLEGQKLYNSSGSLLDHFEQVLSEVKSQKLNLTGELRVTASGAFARLILAPTFNEFSKQHSELRFSFILSDGFVDLIENNIDLAFRIAELPDSQLKAIRIATSRRALFASSDYLESFGSPKTIEDLKKHRLLYYTRLGDRPMWPLHNKDGAKRPFYFEPFFKTDGSDLMREAVLNGVGIAMLPTWMMKGPEGKNQVKRLFEQNAKSSSPIYAVAATSGELTAKQRVVIDFLRKQFEKCVYLTPREG